MRKTLPIILAAAAVLALSACTSSATPNASTLGCTTPSFGSVSSSVSVSGDFGKTPKVTIKAPLKATSTARTVKITGKGAVAAQGDWAFIGLAAYDGTTGKKVTSTGFDGTQTTPIAVDSKQFIPGLVSTIECLPAGSRVVSTALAKTAFGGTPASGSGIKATDSIVFVADVVDVVPPKASGTPQAAKTGFPTVTTASTGQPTVTIPKTTPPTTTKVEVLKKGSGSVVKNGDNVIVQYQGTIWRTGKVFDQSWGSSPAVFPVATGKVIKGFQTALVGQTVGSQVVAIIPPADGYGSAGQSSAGINGTDTLVFVIDVLKTSS